MPKPYNPPLTIVLAATQQRFRAWCRDNDRYERDRAIIAITSPGDVRRVRGLFLRRGVDEIIDLGGPFEAWAELETRFRHA